MQFVLQTLDESAFISIALIFRKAEQENTKYNRAKTRTNSDC